MANEADAKAVVRDFIALVRAGKSAPVIEAARTKGFDAAVEAVGTEFEKLTKECEHEMTEPK